MPLYEFHCAGCGASFDEICAPDAEAPACPACGSAATERMISAPNPILKNPFPFPPTGQVRPLGTGGGRGCPGQCGK